MSVRPELLAHGFEDAYSRQLLDALGERFILALGLEACAPAPN
jgi:hypothetical protein